MKKLIILSTSLLFVVTSCIKGLPIIPPKGKPGPPPVIVKDTIPDSAWFKIQCIASANATYFDQDVVSFYHTANPNYIPGEDAPTFSGYGNTSLSILTNDVPPVKLAISETPFKDNMIIPLYVKGKTNDTYTFSIIQMSTNKTIPSDIHIWCKDNKLLDSTDLRLGGVNFTLDVSDTTTYLHRFSLKISH